MSSPSLTPDDAALARFARAAEEAVAEGRLPFVVAMATDRTGPIFEAAFGTAAPDGPPAGPETVLWLASMTKAITSAAALQLVERGKLDLDAPAARLLPELDTIGVLEGFEADGLPRLRPPRLPLTLRHLLTHTAGFGYDMWHPALARAQAALGLPPLSSGNRQALHLPLLFDPGEGWCYGINTDWVGLLIEAASGMRLGAWLDAHLLGPLGMRDTGFRLPPERRARLARLHVRRPDGDFVPIAAPVAEEGEFERGGGGLYGTVRDYLAFIRLILDEGRTAAGERLLGPASMEGLRKSAVRGMAGIGRFDRATANRSHAFEFFPGLRKGWSLAFLVNEEKAPTGRPAGGLMWAGLANTYYWIDPVNGIGGVFATQLFPFGDPLALDLFMAFERAFYA
jgi:methyl acetate hydrolase